MLNKEIQYSQSNTILKYKSRMIKNILFIISAFIIIIFLIGLASVLGPAKMSIVKSYSIILDKFIPLKNNTISDIEKNIIWNIRLPKILMGLLAGFGLGICGCIMQTVLRNSLASPYTLGISASAGFGAALAIVLNIGIIGGRSLLVGNAFIFSSITSILILLLLYVKNITPSKIILFGIALMYLFQAGITLLQFFAEPYAVQAVVFWLIGDTGRASWDKIFIVFIVISLSLPVMMWKSADLNIISLDDDDAKGLGVNVNQLRIIMILFICLITSSIVAFVGTIGFIGLVAPHITRMLIGNDHKITIIYSGLTGAILLMASDIIALQLLSPIVLPIGVVTAFTGVPLLIYLLIKNKEGVKL